jgi:hypothetical protein
LKKNTSLKKAAMLRAEGTYDPCLKTGDSNKDEKSSSRYASRNRFYFLFRINPGAWTRYGQGRAEGISSSYKLLHPPSALCLLPSALPEGLVRIHPSESLSWGIQTPTNCRPLNRRLSGGLKPLDSSTSRTEFMLNSDSWLLSSVWKIYHWRSQREVRNHVQNLSHCAHHQRRHR